MCFLLNVVNRNENIINAGYWALSEIAKINQLKNPSVLIAKISSRKTQKIVNPQKQTPAKISFHTVSVGKMIGRLINQGQVVIFGSLLASVQVY